MAVILISSASYYYCISGDFLLQAADFTILDVVHISFHFDGVYQLYNLYQYTTSTTVPDLNTTHPNPTKGALFLSSTLLVKLLITQKRDTVQCVQWKLKRSWHSNISSFALTLEFQHVYVYVCYIKESQQHFVLHIYAGFCFVFSHTPFSHIP